MLVKIEVYNDGVCWCARGIGEDIFTQGKTLDELTENIKEAVEVHFVELLEFCNPNDICLYLTTSRPLCYPDIVFFLSYFL
jgi:hypothetical protein